MILTKRDFVPLDTENCYLVIGGLYSDASQHTFYDRVETIAWNAIGENIRRGVFGNKHFSLNSNPWNSNPWNQP
jgi:hypothetical protein